MTVSGLGTKLRSGWAFNRGKNLSRGVGLVRQDKFAPLNTVAPFVDFFLTPAPSGAPSYPDTYTFAGGGAALPSPWDNNDSAAVWLNGSGYAYLNDSSVGDRESFKPCSLAGSQHFLSAKVRITTAVANSEVCINVNAGSWNSAFGGRDSLELKRVGTSNWKIIGRPDFGFSTTTNLTGDFLNTWVWLGLLSNGSTVTAYYKLAASDPWTQCDTFTSAGAGTNIGIGTWNAEAELAEFTLDVAVPQTVSPAGIASASAFGSVTASPGGVTAAVASIASSGAFGTVTTSAGPVTASLASITSAQAFGTLTVTPGPVTVSLASIASVETFGTISASNTAGGTQTVTPASIASSEAFGVPSVVVGAVTVSATSITSGETFGSAVAVPGSVTVSPSSIMSAEAFGTLTVSAAVAVSLTSIVSAEAFGSAYAFATRTVTVTGIASAEAFGSLEVRNDQFVLLLSIETAELFGQIEASRTILDVRSTVQLLNRTLATTSHDIGGTSATTRRSGNGSSGRRNGSTRSLTRSQSSGLGE